MEHQEIIKKGSKSFSMASLFFSEKEKIASWKLYSWCRHSDDLIDEAPDRLIMAKRLTYLREQTQSLSHRKPSDFYMNGLYEVIHSFQLPLKYPLDLLRGMEMDVAGRRYQNMRELEEYCYCVAGAVGLMMCHILGIRDEVALSHAVSMGNAMQLTNIARDIWEDHQRGRLYLPLEWLEEKGIGEEDILEERNQRFLIEFQERLLKRSDELYEEGMRGLRFLSLRSSWAVLIAAMIYSDIGRVIRTNPISSLKTRAIVSRPRKMFLVLKSFYHLVPLMMIHMKSKKVGPPQSIWSMNS